MASLLTCTVGVLVWWLALSCVDGRVAMGRGWPAVHLVGWWLVVRLVVLSGRPPAELATADGRPSLGWALRTTVRALRPVAVVVAKAVLLLGLAFGVLRIGDSAVSLWLAGWFAWAPALLLVSGLVQTLGRWWGALPARHAARTPLARDVALALAPLLFVPLAVVLLGVVELPRPWSALLTPAARSGLLVHAHLPGLWPCALLVAWGVDRLLHGAAGRWSLLGPSLATVVFAVLAVSLPDALAAWHHGPRDDLSRPWWSHALVSYPEGVRRWHPFLHVLPTENGLRLQPLPLAGLTRAGLALLAGAGAVSAWNLWRLGRSPRPSPVPAVAALALGLAGTLWTAWGWGAESGPAGVAWAALLGVLLTVVAGLPRWGRGGARRPG